MHPRRTVRKQRFIPVKRTRRAPPATGGRTSLEPPASLTQWQRRHLRGLAHALKPVIRLGSAGLTEGVATETARALHDHELIKVKAAAADRELRQTQFEQLARRTNSALVHRIGHIAVLFKPRSELPRIIIPDAPPPAG
ncbi:MAG TPA: ribosome assembly RNA-binding protein YhbY [Steroidobacteraceae bacterium]